MTETRETKLIVANRVPPGDKWQIIGEKTIYQSLTDLLEAYYQQYRSTKFYLNARAGTVEVVIETTIESPIDKKFSIYGED